ncbi:MAG: glycosyltransferase family 2 protein [Rhodospirillales bacterium]|nr:glycosyltransferase family 2 protein [Rhodospirillales bacterium]
MRIGVVIPAYNLGARLTGAIRSVLEQSHRDLAVAVVDDGSTDETLALARSQRDARLILISQPNQGVSAARNRGLAALPPVDAVLFLDGDDRLAPDALARLCAALAAAPDAVAAVGPSRTGNARPRPAPGGAMLEALLIGNRYVNGGQMLIRAGAVAAVGGFHPGLRFGEDWEYWARLACLGPFAVAQGAAPVLHVESRAEGAYRRHATDPQAFRACLVAIHGNPAITARLPSARRATLRRRAEAECAWIIGRELLRARRQGAALGWMARSVAAAPRPKRIGLLALACLPRGWPGARGGPFREYAA